MVDLVQKATAQPAQQPTTQLIDQVEPERADPALMPPSDKALLTESRTGSSTPLLPRRIWVRLLIALFGVGVCVYYIGARLTPNGFSDEKVVAGVLALFGVLSTSILSSFFSYYTLVEGRQKSDRDRLVGLQLADQRERHERQLADTRARHEDNLAEAERSHELAMQAESKRNKEDADQLQRKHESDMRDEANKYNDKTAAEERRHSREMEDLRGAHVKELERIRYSYSLKKDVDQREYNELTDRINQLSRAAVNANDAVQKLSTRASEMSSDDMVESTGHIFVTVSPLFASPAGGAPVLPRTLVKLLTLVRGRFTAVFLCLSEKKSEREKVEYNDDLKSKLASLDEGVKSFVGAVGPAKAKLREELISDAEERPKVIAIGDDHDVVAP